MGEVKIDIFYPNMSNVLSNVVSNVLNNLLNNISNSGLLLLFFAGMTKATQDLDEVSRDSIVQLGNFFSKAAVDDLCCKTLHDIINEESFRRKIFQEDENETYRFFISTLKNHTKNIKVLSKKPMSFHIEKLLESLDAIVKNEKSSKCREDLLKVFGLLSILRIRVLREILHHCQGHRFVVERIIDVLIEINGYHVTDIDEIHRVESTDRYLYHHLSMSSEKFPLKLEGDYELGPNAILEIIEATGKMFELNSNKPEKLMHRDVRFQVNKAMVLTYCLIKRIYNISDLIKTDF